VGRKGTRRRIVGLKEEERPDRLPGTREKVDAMKRG